MKPLQILPMLIATAAPAASVAMEGTLLKTLPHGVYECAIPGDAGGPVWQPIEGAGFVISHTSAYRSEAGNGTYLLKGKELIFTRGPKKGERYRRTGDATLKDLDDSGNLGKLTCTRVASRH